MPMIARSASGLRHLRFAREVLASLEALEADTPTSAPERALVASEVAAVTALVARLSAAVKPYRDYLERERTKARGRRRVAVRRAIEQLERAGTPLPASRPLWSKVGASALLAALEGARLDLVEARAALEASLREEREVVAPRRDALHASLRTAIDEVRDGIGAMDRRLRARLDPSLVEALYPELTGSGAYVADDPDPDDDATREPSDDA